MAEMYTNKTTGGLFTKIATAVDCTNGRDGTAVVIYRDWGGRRNRLFVRAATEFSEQFEIAPPLRSAEAEVADIPQVTHTSTTNEVI